MNKGAPASNGIPMRGRSSVPAVIAFVLAVTSCSAVRPPQARYPSYTPNFGPDVDPACIEDVRSGGDLGAMAISAVRGYQVTRPERTFLYLLRRGRPLSEHEAYAARDGLRLSVGIANHTQECPGVGRASCLRLDVSLCQSSLTRLTQELDANLARIDALDAELGVYVHVLELESGPRCRSEDDEACLPEPHYSTEVSWGWYDPKAPRVPTSFSSAGGRCEGDGDCNGKDSNACLSWYLRGQAETMEYSFLVTRLGPFRFTVPIFCGCVDGACTWFTQ